MVGAGALLCWCWCGCWCHGCFFTTLEHPNKGSATKLVADDGFTVAVAGERVGGWLLEEAEVVGGVLTFVLVALALALAVNRSIFACSFFFGAVDVDGAGDRIAGAS